MKRTTLLLSLLALLGSALLAQDPPAETPTPAATPAPGARPGGAASQDPQPYDKVITKDAKTKKGVFLVHQIKDRYYYEIPKSELGREFLWVAQIARTTNGVGYGGQALGSRVVRWDRRGDRILLREVNYDVVADPKQPISRAVRAANNESIIQSFPVAANGKDDSAVIEVTRFFTTDVFELSAKQRLSANTLDPARTFIERISTYPENIEAETSHTYSRNPSPAGAAGPNPLAAAGMRPGSATVVLHYSMVRLPETPMMPRLLDERVGYFSIRQTDYGKEEQRAPEVRYITRWRLEKKDPNAAISEPVKPIIYWIDAATPAKYIPYMKAGIESWNKAFEAAGFKNAIIGRVAPTPEEDPDFSPEDARYSVIRWLPSTIENASGPHIHDPRSGEILDSDIQFYHNVMNLARMWYVVQAGPLDPRAQKLPIPDDLMGKLVQYVCAHEVGHTLGFPHNMKGSSMYPAEKVRDAAWVKKMGHTPSIMDYSRFNYVAQPEDKIDVDDLIPGIGPYDMWATRWGYSPIPNAKTPEDERATLDQWAREQDTTPWYRFMTARASGSDPGELTEAVGDADAIASTTLGLKNLQRVAKFLIPATTAQTGESYDDLAELYGRMLGQWSLEMNHVAAIVGGFNSHQKHVGQQGVLFQPVPKERQAAAVKFLNDNAFASPTWAVDPEVIRRIEPAGVLRRIGGAQSGVLNNLLSSARLARLVESETIDGATAYAPVDFLADVRRGVWKELEGPQVKIDAWRRNLQRAYLDLANNKVNGPAPTAPAGGGRNAPPAPLFSGDERGLYRAELRTLNASLTAALGKTTDRATRAHLEAARDQITKILDPKVTGPAATPAPGARPSFTEWTGVPEEDGVCWPDHRIDQ